VGGVRIAAYTYDRDGNGFAEYAPRWDQRQHFDAATGLYYSNARYGACPERCRRDPTIARFISPDTIVPNAGDQQAWNRYAYVLGNREEKKAPHVFTVHPD
jgi:RHS repeat-associated protein